MRLYHFAQAGVDSIRGKTLLLGAAFALELLVASSGFAQSAAATLAAGIPAGEPTPVSVLTYHNDVARTGQNLRETLLTPANVTPSTFGKIGFLATEGRVDAQPLYVPNLSVAGVSRNVLFVATERDKVYAFDADTFSLLWQVSLLGPGESPSDDRKCINYKPEIGITSTPVIDPQAGPNGTIYLVAMSKDNNKNYYQRMHALDLATGAARPGSPTDINATFPNSSGQLTFDPKLYSLRAALLLLDGTIYMGWGSHCDHSRYTGWVMGYDASTLKQTAVLNITPNGSKGAIWMSGGGPAADSSGNIYLITGNGTFDTALDQNGFPSNRNFGNAMLKLSTEGGTLRVVDYFTMRDTVRESNREQDFGAGGVLLLPDMVGPSGETVRLAVGGGKSAVIYVVNRDSMGKFTRDDSTVYQKMEEAVEGRILCTPAYYNNTVYFGASKDFLRAFPLQDAKLASTSSSASDSQFVFVGATPSISANGSSNGIVWAVNSAGNYGSDAELHAFDANDLGNELYNSGESEGNRDDFSANQFLTPTISNGKVYVGTQTGVAVFGLFRQPGLEPESD